MNIQEILCILRPYFFFAENDFFKPTHPTKVLKIPHFFETFPQGGRCWSFITFYFFIFFAYSRFVRFYSFTVNFSIPETLLPTLVIFSEFQAFYDLLFEILAVLVYCLPNLIPSYKASKKLLMILFVVSVSIVQKYFKVIKSSIYFLQNLTFRYF